ncbi:hypothetical protein M422DRAFT_148861 [Sphaerobolus stellatus SS14]|nr:hypothetical protein M422DRAFT_148861 [Sphaerobolus stellatus SS14]
MSEKRKASPPPSGTLTISKRPRGSSPSANTQQIAISSAGTDASKGLIRTVPRTSGLEAPIVSLAGAHGGEILSARFDPSGENIAVGSGDRTVSLWKTYPPTTNYGHLATMHKTAVTDLQWSLLSPLIYSVSADKTVVYSDTTTGERVRKLRGHHGVINAVDRTVAGGTELLATASDDSTVLVWEGGTDGNKHPVAEFQIGCPATAVCWGADGNSVYVGGLDNEIHVYDLRKQARVYSLTGHTDTVASLALSPNGNFLLAPSFSSQTIIHDIRPFSPSPTRIHRVLHGAPAGFENVLSRGAWSKDDGGNRVGVGGADRTVTVWEVESGKILYKLPGHRGTVTCVDFHPKEPVILTGSKDATVLLGELDPGVRV